MDRRKVLGIVVALLVLATWDGLLHGDRWPWRRHSTRASAGADAPLQPPAGPPSGKCLDLVAPRGPIACPYSNDSGPTPDASAKDDDKDKDLGRLFEARNHCRALGQLRVSSGEVVAVDPLVNLEGPPFPTRVPTGQFPVVLSVTADGDVAAALLQLGATRPVRWRHDDLAYFVDAGTGCFVDKQGANEILARQSRELDRAAAVVERTVDPSNGDAWHRAMQAEQARVPDLLAVLIAAGYRGPDRGANVCIDPVAGTNLIAFSSGAGDGVYTTYFGYDAGGALVALITDFDVGGSDDDD